ncbi:bifunctional diguanylate cyclase/phosphodiesterase [Pelomonas sp. KK5]|uniref:putative bifunctional diguanylate cyclase/phosphodiesterase n=1 Tax=Pelomonas sp. KK5 TaxID=1855730 RepID=UPI00117C56AE|nr:bifunctional diguanylate cyclase/phosphodiesterase [Pelomonas sp. KK5]
MTWLILLSASLNAMLGVTLLLLWRIERRHAYVRQWGWSWILLSIGLTLGVALATPGLAGLRYDLQALAASCSLMGSLLLQVAGARAYRGLPWRLSNGLPLFAAMMVALVVVAGIGQVYAVIVGAAFMVIGAWLCAFWMWRGGNAAERFVALCFVAMGCVHASGPMLDAYSRSPITHTLGLYVQMVLSLGLVLLSVRRAHNAARQQAERFIQLAQVSLQALAVVQNRRLVYANPAALAMFGLRDEAHALGLDLITTIPPELLIESRARHAEVLANPQARIEWESARLTADQRRIHLRSLSSHISWDGEPAELQVMIDDTSRRRATEALRRQALHDELTDLPNRNFAVERLRELTWPGAEPFALISADLDRFQLVNESLGHEVGDALLRAIARRLAHQLPPQARPMRLGEDQFLVIVEGAGDAAAALVVAEAMLGLLETPFAVEGNELFVHLSAGIALYPQDGVDGPALLRAADSAMHRAKASAGASCIFFDRSMNGASRARLEIEQALGRAIAARQFLLEYQPKFTAGTRALCGFEALVRWEWPERGRIPPGEFIPAAERTGQIKALGELILELAGRQLQAWQQRVGPERLLPVAVNVSPLQFEDAGFATRLLAGLAARGLPTSALEIEITETAAIGSLSRVLPQLQRLHEAGVHCSLDDFGTGQSSLTLLRQLPISAMKLDRSMIEPLPEAQAAAVVSATCALGRSLKLQIVAEGVEDEVQARAAEELGCTQLQGYHLGRPMAAELAGQLLDAPCGT